MLKARFELPVAEALAVASAVSEIPGVARLFSGHFGEIALLFPRQRVHGLRFLSPREDSAIAIHVVVAVATAPPLAELAEQIRTCARQVCPALTRVDVIFADAV